MRASRTKAILFAVATIALLLGYSAVPSGTEPEPPVVTIRPSAQAETPVPVEAETRDPSNAQPSAVSTTTGQEGTDRSAAGLRYLKNADGSWKGNGRAVIPLLLTHLKYHGTSLFATTVQGWIRNFLEPQGNIDLIVFYEASTVPLKDLIELVGLKSAPAPATAVPPKDALREGAPPLTDAEQSLIGTGYFYTKYGDKTAIRLHPVTLMMPEYIVKEPELLNRSDWLRCGCPPYCIAGKQPRRSTPEYVQGTRWYTHDLFLEPLVLPYSYWIKMDVDIWVFRASPINWVDAMKKSGRIFAHTGKAYNGGGCSNRLHGALIDYCSSNGITPASASSAWWKQDDNVYYSNFVISAMGFHTDPEYLRLAKYLNEFRDGFFRYRWTDQSLFHKVFGIFFGPNESDFTLDWFDLRCQAKSDFAGKTFHPEAFFYHGKSRRPKAKLKLCTKT